METDTENQNMLDPTLVATTSAFLREAIDQGTLAQIQPDKMFKLAGIAAQDPNTTAAAFGLENPSQEQLTSDDMYNFFVDQYIQATTENNLSLIRAKQESDKVRATAEWVDALSSVNLGGSDVIGSILFADDQTIRKLEHDLYYS